MNNQMVEILKCAKLLTNPFRKNRREANTQFESYLEANFGSVFILCKPNFQLSLLLDVKN